MAETFETMMQKERERLTKARQDASSRIDELTQEIASIDRELEAIAAYEQVKTGSAPQIEEAKDTGGKRAQTQKAQKGGAGRRSQSERAPRGSRQQQLVDLLGQHEDGLTRGDILRELGLKGNAGLERSITNVLATMKKAGRVRSEDGRYTFVET